MSAGFPLLSGVDLEIERGTLNVVTGANSAGKTSLLRLLGGLDALTSGDGVVAGIDLATGDRRQLRRRVGWLGHEGSFYSDLTVRENLTFAARALERPLDEVASALDRVGLGHRLDTMTKQLSAGQRRRLGLAWYWCAVPSSGCSTSRTPLSTTRDASTSTVFSARSSRGGPPSSSARTTPCDRRSCRCVTCT